MKLNCAIHLYCEARSGIIGERECGSKRGAIPRFVFDLVCHRVNWSRREPMLQIKRSVLCEKDRELPAFWAKPKTVFPAARIDVRLNLAGGNQLAINPAETVARVSMRSAGHHTPLPGGNNRYFGLVL